MKDKIGNPLVTVITPSLNQGDFIGDNLSSVMKQDYLNVEHLVFDGGSTDHSLEIIKKYAQKSPKIRWVSEPDNGQADAINKGFSIAQGDIVTWLNADDAYIYPDTLSQVCEQFDKNPDLDVLYGDVILINDENRLLKIQSTPPFNYQRLLYGCYIKQPALFFRREIIQTQVLDPVYEYALDYEFWLRIGKIFKFKHISQLWAVDRNHPGRKILAHRDLMHQESISVSDKYGLSSDSGRKILRWLDYKVNVGLRSRVLGLIELFGFYRNKDNQKTSLKLIWPPFLEVLQNQVWGKNKDLY